jgi:cytosine/adenosine deaminase-related metal-dependent hydrolase
VGIRVCLSYEVSDRDGNAADGIEENRRFAKRERKKIDPLIRSLVGAHASFTISDETAAELKQVCNDREMGIHIHAAEDMADVQYTLSKYNERVVQRLHDAGLLDQGGILAHCVHIDTDEIEIMRKKKVFVAHCPQSNANNAVGVAPVEEMMERGIPVGLGTDGYSSSMFSELRALGQIHKLHKKDPRAMPPDKMAEILLVNNAKLASDTFGQQLGILKKDAAADIITLPYNPPTPLTEENYFSHLFFGISENPGVQNAIVAGRVIMENGKLTLIDESEIREVTRSTAEKLWEKMEAARESNK